MPPGSPRPVGGRHVVDALKRVVVGDQHGVQVPGVRGDAKVERRDGLTLAGEVRARVAVGGRDRLVPRQYVHTLPQLGHGGMEPRGIRALGEAVADLAGRDGGEAQRGDWDGLDTPRDRVMPLEQVAHGVGVQHVARHAPQSSAKGSRSWAPWSRSAKLNKSFSVA